MVQRNTPCTECRKHRRKCIRDGMTEVCSRCKRLERKCITANMIDLYLSDSESAKNAIQEIEYLSSAIKDLEKQINQLKSSNTIVDKSQDSSAEQGLIQYKGNTAISNDWTLTIQNGQLHIETGIKSISDLLLNCPPIQYLSPFQAPTEKGFVLEFGARKNMCLRVLASKLMFKSLGKEQHDNRELSLLSLPTSLLFDARSMVDQLLQIYFECHITFHPLIHQPSFMRYYKQLDNPLGSLICLCICCFVCGSPCQHTLRHFGDLTDIGKYFAGLAKLKLMEQFDVKEKRLENMVASNLLVFYLHSILLNKESRNILSMSYQIAVDLLPWYKKESESEAPSIECVIFSRNASSPLMGYQRSMRHFSDTKASLYKQACMPWLSLQDEPADIIDYVGAQNRLIDLYNHPILLKLKDQTRGLMLGGECSLPFDLIIGLDQAVNEWRDGLPERYRMCNDWLNLEQCQSSINQCTDGLALIAFMNFLIYMLGVYSQMIQPKHVPDNNILSIVEKMILERALYCCQMVMCGFNRARWLDVNSCRYVLAMKRYLFHIADVLVALSSSSNEIVKKEAQSMFQSCITAIESIAFTKTINLDPSKSPLLSKGTIPPKELDDINLSAYFSSPQPWYTLILDMCRYLNSNTVPRENIFEQHQHQH